MPQIATLRNYREPFPDDARIRTDSGVLVCARWLFGLYSLERPCSEISIHYDLMISKLIVHGRDREEALQLMRDPLSEEESSSELDESDKVHSKQFKEDF